MRSSPTAGVARQNVAYIGDDLTDIVIMRRVGSESQPQMPARK